jgi:hypothetical protein
VDALVVVVNGYRQPLLGGFLADDVLVQVLLQFQRLRQFVRGGVRGIVAIVFQDGVADCNALVTDVRSRIIAGGRNQLPDDVLALVTKGTAQRFVGTHTLHWAAPARFDFWTNRIYTGICSYYRRNHAPRQ